MEAKFTKGEWSVQKIHGIVIGVGVSQNVQGGVYTEMICDMILPDTYEEYHNSNIEEDASLISAAPDLYDALQSALPYLQQYALDIVTEKAKQALQKATK